MKKEEYEIIDSTSRPGYIKLKVKKSGKEYWARIKTEIDPINTEYSKLTKNQRKALGLWPGIRTKSFSEMTEEEQKLFTENDNSQE